MQRTDIIKAVSEFMENANIDTDSQLYQQADAALLALMTGNIEETDKTIAITWGIEDVQEVRPDLSDADAWKVLQAVETRHDANIGINWEYIEAVAEDVFPE